MVIAYFLINDKARRSRVFEETFLLTDIIMNIALEMLFLTLNNIDINFTKWDFANNQAVKSLYKKERRVLTIKNVQASGLDDFIFKVQKYLVIGISKTSEKKIKK